MEAYRLPQRELNLQFFISPHHNQGNEPFSQGKMGTGLLNEKPQNNYLRRNKEPFSRLTGVRNRSISNYIYYAI